MANPAIQGTVGWIGAGRMGYELVRRLLAGGCDVTVWNRSREKAEPLAAEGAKIADSPRDLADRDLVITIVANNEAFTEVTVGPQGVLSGDTAPPLLIDSSTVSVAVSEQVRAAADQLGTAFLAAPVSGSPKTVRAGRLGVVVSGPQAAYEQALPYLSLYGPTVTYVGEGERARLVKICHNLLLGVVAQTLAETAVLAEKGGIARSDYLAFINGSVMGSTFTRYKAPALVNLDWTPSFTSSLLRKDFELGLAAARELDVPLPVSATVHQLLTALIGNGFGEDDFATLLQLEADGAGLELVSEDRDVPDGLSDQVAS